MYDKNFKMSIVKVYNDLKNYNIKGDNKKILTFISTLYIIG
jgi:hypothetical protein